MENKADLKKIMFFLLHKETQTQNKEQHITHTSFLNTCCTCTFGNKNLRIVSKCVKYTQLKTVIVLFSCANTKTLWKICKSCSQLLRM